MYKTGEEASAFIRTIIPLIKNTSYPVFLAVPFTAIQDAVQAAQGSNIIIGAQNMHDAEEGAYTGEISGRMLKSAGAQFVILGHSERRQYFFETNEWINRKVKSALKIGLKPILCIGETDQERQQGLTKEILLGQISECLKGISENEKKPLVVAYEPIWAIGTGKTATPQMAQETHALCRRVLAKQIPLIYGGSVKPDNIAALIAEPDIDGALVGGASLNVDTFANIINNGFKL